MSKPREIAKVGSTKVACFLNLRTSSLVRKQTRNMQRGGKVGAEGTKKKVHQISNEDDESCLPLFGQVPQNLHHTNRVEEGLDSELVTCVPKYDEQNGLLMCLVS